jgi:hypothetical protein
MKEKIFFGILTFNEERSRIRSWIRIRSCQRYGSGDPDPTKMSRIPNTAPSYHYTFCRSDFIHAMENDIKPAFGAAAEVLEGYLSRGIINWGEPVQGTRKKIIYIFFFINFYGTYCLEQ